MNHHVSNMLHRFSNPPGNAVRVHQHLKIGDGDVYWDDFCGGLKTSRPFVEVHLDGKSVGD